MRDRGRGDGARDEDERSARTPERQALRLLGRRARGRRLVEILEMARPRLPRGRAEYKMPSRRRRPALLVTGLLPLLPFIVGLRRRDGIYETSNDNGREEARGMTGDAIEIYGPFRMRAIGSASLSGARLFRSRELSGMTAEDARVLSERFGVRLICDVRSQWEIAASPEPAVGLFDYVATLPSFERRRKDAGCRLVAGVIGEYGAPGERMLSNYRRYVTGYPGIGRAVRAIAAEDSPALVHCVNGKDRTGVLSAVLLVAAGAHPDDVMADYLAVNAVNADLIEEEAERLGIGMTPYEREILMSFLEARPEYLAAFFDEAGAVYSTLDRYLSEGIRLAPAGRDVIAGLLGRQGR